MIDKIKEIIDGLKNTYFRDEGISDEGKRRLFICLLTDGPYEHCRHYEEDGSVFGPKCTGCGCFLKYKVHSQKSKCPLGKWEK